MTSADEEPFAFQLADRLSDGGAADSEFLGNLCFQHPLARLEPAIQNGVSDADDGGVSQRRIGGNWCGLSSVVMQLFPPRP
jgi:hypothetical protein